MRASGRISAKNSRYSAKASSSYWRGITFTVIYTFTPRVWAYSMASLSSSSVKLSDAVRIPKRFPARYTASAP